MLTSVRHIAPHFGSRHFSIEFYYGSSCTSLELTEIDAPLQGKLSPDKPIVLLLSMVTNPRLAQDKAGEWA